MFTNQTETNPTIIISPPPIVSTSQTRLTTGTNNLVCDEPEVTQYSQWLSFCFYPIYIFPSRVLSHLLEQQCSGGEYGIVISFGHVVHN